MALLPGCPWRERIAMAVTATYVPDSDDQTAADSIDEGRQATQPHGECPVSKPERHCESRDDQTESDGRGLFERVAEVAAQDVLGEAFRFGREHDRSLRRPYRWIRGRQV